MKKIIALLLVMSVASQLAAQDSLKKRHIGIELAYAKPSVFSKDGFFPSLTFSLNKQVIFAGPSIVYYDQQHPEPLFGAQAGYRIFPNGRARRFNLFFEYNVNFIKGNLKDNIGYPWIDYYPGYGWDGTRTIHLTSIDNYFGFGFRWNIFRNFYLSSNIGIGLGVYKEEYTYNYKNGVTYESKGNLAFRDPIGTFNRLFKIGIGYDLVNFKKKNK